MPAAQNAYQQEKIIAEQLHGKKVLRICDAVDECWSIIEV
jgi:hypothetical protein